MRVVSYRYGLTGARFDQIWEFTSADGGASFDAGHPVGIAPFDEAVRGPGDTLTVTTNAESTGLAVQNVPLDGTDAGESQAILSADHPYNGALGLAGPTMVAVFADASSNAQVRTSRRRAQRRGDLDAARRHRLRRLPAAGRRPVGPVPALRDPGERPHRAQVRRHHVRRPP